MSKKVVGYKATGSLVLIEMLKADEILGSNLILSENTKVEAPQGYILDIGPGLEQDKWGFKVGDRIVFSGSFVPFPKSGSDQSRQAGVIDAHAVKGVLHEEKLVA